RRTGASQARHQFAGLAPVASQHRRQFAGLAPSPRRGHGAAAAMAAPRPRRGDSPARECLCSLSPSLLPPHDAPLPPAAETVAALECAAYERVDGASRSQPLPPLSSTPLPRIRLSRALAIDTIAPAAREAAKIRSTSKGDHLERHATQKTREHRGS